MPSTSLAIRSVSVKAAVKRVFWLRGSGSWMAISLTTRAGRRLKITTLSDR